jgi:O-succinylbenzoate synthase
LGACSGRPIEYVEQPLPPGQDEAILSLASEFPTQIALDESVARHSDLLRWLEFGWPGIYVIKPSLAGSPSRLLHLLEGYEAEAVFSSAFETAVGARAAMLLSTHASGAPRPIGFGSAACFADDRWNLALRGPTISSKALARLDISHVWDLSLQTPSAS